MKQPTWQRLAMTMFGAGTLVWTAATVAQDTGSQTKAPTQERKSKTPDRSPEDLRVSGVIVKLEPYRTEESAKSSDDASPLDKPETPTRLRLTINTLAVWRDYVRDQAVNPKKVAKAGSKDGENSVATKGEPIQPANLVVVDLGPETRLATRYRSSTDETDSGGQTVAQAEANEKDPKDTTKAKPGGRRSAAKPPQIHLKDFEKGMFVEAEFRRSEDLNAASKVSILKPIGGPDTPAGEPESESVSGAK